MLYFPSNKPLLTEYPNNIKYLIDRITYNDENINPDSFINKIRLKDKFNISIKHNLKKLLNNDNVLNLIQNINGDTKLHYDYNNLFYELIDKSDILAKEPEGYIFKWKKNLILIFYTFTVRNKIT